MLVKSLRMQMSVSQNIMSSLCHLIIFQVCISTIGTEAFRFRLFRSYTFKLEPAKTRYGTVGSHCHDVKLNFYQWFILFKRKRKISVLSGVGGGHVHKLTLYATRRKPQQLFYFRCDGCRNCKDKHPKKLSFVNSN